MAIISLAQRTIGDGLRNPPTGLRAGITLCGAPFLDAAHALAPLHVCQLHLTASRSKTSPATLASYTRNWIWQLTMVAFLTELPDGVGTLTKVHHYSSLSRD